ncbi:uncharacterized protein [Amphiura filiformis]|uniref:uncharacterized protein isoform X2 n=1 Tax=Amphiura filiformis TaxID=82378 RepID=UPI003B2242CD
MTLHTSNLWNPHDVRWLSLDHAVSTLYQVWEAVVTALENDATGDGLMTTTTAAQAKAKGILDRVKTYTFIGSLAILSDVLPKLTELSKGFQSNNLNFNKVSSLLVLCEEDLEDMCDKMGTAEKEALGKIDPADNKHKVKGIELQPSEHSIAEVEAAKIKF